MIERYQHSGIAGIWNPEAEYRRWMEVELAAVGVQFPDRTKAITGALNGLLRNGDIAPQVRRIEQSTGHDVAAFVELCVRELDKDDALSQYFHHRLTSSDVVDTANALAVARASGILSVSCQQFVTACGQLSDAHGSLPAAGRTHGRAARPIVFGDRAQYWRTRMESAALHAVRAMQSTPVGRMGGPTGSEIGEALEVKILSRLGLPSPRRPHIQCTDRVLYYRILAACLEVGLVLEKVATDVRLLAVEEVGEVNEGYPPGRVGSSSMPHKRNPVNFEKVCGLVRLLRGYVSSMAECAPLWLERDISHSSVERVVVPDFFHVLLHCLETATEGIRNLRVDASRVRENLERSAGKMGSYDTLHEDAKTHGRSAAHRRGRGEPEEEGAG